MELIERRISGPARLFLGEDMTEGLGLDTGSGSAVVYSSRSPGKPTANEDAAGFFPFRDGEGALAVADGLGGARAGQQASSLAMKMLEEALEQGVRDRVDLREAVLNGFENANRAVLDLGVGAATTLAVVEIRGALVRPYHVGDSLILLTGQRGKVKLQSVPHSPVGYGIESGLLDEDEAMYHEQRHIVSNVIGTPTMRIEIGPTVTLAPRDTLLIASDGLWDNLHNDEIVSLVRKGGLEPAARALAAECDHRMREDGVEGTPSKPDDLTFILFRLHHRPRRGAPVSGKET